MDLYRKVAIVTILIAVAVTISLAAPHAAVAEERIHIVKTGDTLWDISSSYLYDPFLWPRIWNVNRDIENPHLIHPGQEIIIPMEMAQAPKPRKVVKPVLPPPPPPPPPVVEEPPVVVEPVEPEPTPEEVKQELIRALSVYGFIIDQEEIGIGTISSLEETRLLIGQNDKVYVTTERDSPLTVDEKYSIVRVFEKVKHPVTKKTVGYLARVLGDLTVVDSTDGLSTAIVGDVYRDILLNDSVIEYIDYLQWLPKEGDIPAAGLTGYILINPEGRKIMGEQDVAFLDLGSSDGLRTGDSMELVKEKGKIKSPAKRKGIAPPLVVIGEIEIIIPREKTSVVRIIRSDREIDIGTKVVSSTD